MKDEHWSDKRFITMNLETTGEITMFRALLDSRTTVESPLVRIVMAADTWLADEIDGWARKQIQRGKGLRAWMVPWNYYQDNMKILNTISSHEALEKTLLQAREKKEEFHILGIQTGQENLLEALDEMMETAAELVLRDTGGTIIQGCCRNLLIPAEGPDEQIISMYGNALEVMFYITESGHPVDITSLVDQQECLAAMKHLEDWGSVPVKLPELKIEPQEYREMNLN